MITKKEWCLPPLCREYHDDIQHIAHKAALFNQTIEFGDAVSRIQRAKFTVLKDTHEGEKHLSAARNLQPRKTSL